VTATTTTDKPSTTTTGSFNTKSAEFVPRGKMVKTTEAFPTLDMGITKEAPKKKVVPQV